MNTTETPQPETQNEAESLNDVNDVLNQIAPHWRTIVGVGVVVTTVFVLFGFISSNRKAAEETNWATYLEAVDSGNPEALQELAENSSGSVVPWAYQAAAQGRLVAGMQNLFTDREQARSTLEEAAGGFAKAIETSAKNDLLNQRSMWGLGQANEGLNELEKAKKAYQELLDRWPESPLAKRAQERITSLNEPQTQEFYRWFFEQSPPASDVGTTFDGGTDAFTLPNEPDVSIPDLPSSGANDEGGFDFGETTEEEKADEAESGETEESSTEESSTEEPSAEEPAESTSGAESVEAEPATIDPEPATESGELSADDLQETPEATEAVDNDAEAPSSDNDSAP